MAKGKAALGTLHGEHFEYFRIASSIFRLAVCPDPSFPERSEYGYVRIGYGESNGHKGRYPFRLALGGTGRDMDEVALPFPFILPLPAPRAPRADRVGTVSTVSTVSTISLGWRGEESTNRRTPLQLAQCRVRGSRGRGRGERAEGRLSSLPPSKRFNKEPHRLSVAPTDPHSVHVPL